MRIVFWIKEKRNRLSHLPMVKKGVFGLLILLPYRPNGSF